VILKDVHVSIEGSVILDGLNRTNIRRGGEGGRERKEKKRKKKKRKKRKKRKRGFTGEGWRV
jgi:hypothetical protein